MRTLLLNLPWRENNRCGVRAGSRWPFTSKVEENGYIKYIPFPFFLAYAASLLKSRNKDVKIVDAIAQGLDEQKTLDEISAACFQLIVIEISTPSFDNDMELVYKIRQKILNSKIVLCGPHATTYAKDILGKYDFIDYILVGEYEYTLMDLVSSLEDSLDLKSVLGLAYRNMKNIVINESRPTIGNLDELPWPERESLFIYKYNDGFAELPVPNVQMWSSRGCPFRCMFCLWPQVFYGEHKYRKRNPIDVVDEMEWLIKKFNFKAVYFDDDVFNIDKAHVISICEKIKKKNIKVPWAVMGRADLMDEKLLSLLASAGLYAIKYGIESANSKVLKLCKKNLNLAKAKKMIAYTKKLGIKVHLTFCLGLPGETKQSVQDSVDFIGVTRPDSLQFSLATPFPGTDYFRYLEKNGTKLSRDYPDYNGNNKYIARTKELSNLDLERLKRDLCSNLNFK
jgi:radical SAM superfamily enzyme YgiQ (UPF0313 family)